MIVGSGANKVRMQKGSLLKYLNLVAVYAELTIPVMPSRWLLS
jgi:hypothetical protein